MFLFLWLHQGGANVDTTGQASQTALHIACHRAKLQTVEALLELGWSLSSWAFNVMSTARGQLKTRIRSFSVPVRKPSH